MFYVHCMELYLVQDIMLHSIHNCPHLIVDIVRSQTQFATLALKNLWDFCECHMVRNVNIVDIQIKTNMVANKHFAWGTWGTRYPHLWAKNKKVDPISFFRFPVPKRSPEKRKRWIKSCHQGDGFECKKDHYICVGGNGPT